MQVSRVKVGLVGLGLVCESHIKAYLANPNAEVVAVCDLDGARAEAIARKHGIEKVYTSYEEMLKDPGINTVDITTPTVLHVPMSIAAVKSGRNVLCEKPFCMTLEEGLAASEEARKKGVTLMVGKSYIFMTSIMKARALIDAGEIGKPSQIRERFGAWVERPWRTGHEPCDHQRSPGLAHGFEARRGRRLSLDVRPLRSLLRHRGIPDEGCEDQGGLRAEVRHLVDEGRPGLIRPC